MRIKPEVDFRFSPPTNSSVPSGFWWSVSNLVKIGEELRTISSGTDRQTEKPPCAADLIIYHFFAILANVVDNNNNSMKCVLQHGAPARRRVTTEQCTTSRFLILPCPAAAAPTHPVRFTIRIITMFIYSLV